MLKHVVKHNQRRGVLLYREVPGEGHMCLLVYSDILPSMIHDEIMKVLESEVGQAAKDFADALFRHIMPDGNNCLESLHRNGHIQKVPCNQVIIQANAKSTVRLDELNEILNEMAKGDEAVKRLAELDAATGMSNGIRKKRVVEGREVGQPMNTLAKPVEIPATPTPVASVLTDADIAQNLLSQAERMKQQAASLLAEVARLTEEAVALTPAVKVKKTNGPKTKVKAN